MGADVQKCAVVRRISGNARIDPKLVADADFDIACSVLAASIRIALADPQKRADYEAWLVKYRERTTPRTREGR